MVAYNPTDGDLNAADDDRSHSRVITTLLEKFRQAKIPAEVHLYAQGGHAFNMGNRSKLTTIKGWPQRMADWMADSGILVPAQPSPTGK